MSIEDLTIQVTCGEMRKVLRETFEMKFKPILEQMEAVVKKVENVRTALELFACDPHQFGDRLCQTCANISKLLGEKWGCYKSGKDLQFRGG